MSLWREATFLSTRTSALRQFAFEGCSCPRSVVTGKSRSTVLLMATKRNHKIYIRSPQSALTSQHWSIVNYKLSEFTIWPTGRVVADVVCRLHGDVERRSFCNGLPCSVRQTKDEAYWNSSSGQTVRSCGQSAPFLRDSLLLNAHVCNSLFDS